jgi:flagellar motor protein MotB
MAPFDARQQAPKELNDDLRQKVGPTLKDLQVEVARDAALMAARGEVEAGAARQGLRISLQKLAALSLKNAQKSQILIL